MTIKKPKPADFMASAIYTAFNDLDEVFALISLLRSYLKTDSTNEYTINEAINGIMSLLINIQSDLIEHSKVEEYTK